MGREEFQSAESLAEARASLQRMQEFDPETLVRTDELGAANNFADAVEPARLMISNFGQIPIGSLEVFSSTELIALKTMADGVFNIFQEIMDFSLEAGDVQNRRSSLVQKLWRQVQPNFTKLMPLVSFAMAKTVDFGQLEGQARASLQAVKDQTDAVLERLQFTEKDAGGVLDEVRRVAAEIGVTQEAKHFAHEAKSHADASRKWLIASILSVAGLGAIAILNFFAHKISWLAVSSRYELVQFSIAKFLLFGALLYGVSFTVRNYSAHRHNSVTNRHRQNALMTYKTLVEASGSEDVRDAVLQHAAAAIYSPNDSGYVKNEERGYNGSPVLNLPRSFLQGASSADN
jgi:hypothetical protein